MNDLFSSESWDLSMLCACNNWDGMPPHKSGVVRKNKKIKASRTHNVRQFIGQQFSENAGYSFINRKPCSRTNPSGFEIGAAVQIRSVIPTHT